MFLLLLAMPGLVLSAAVYDIPQGRHIRLNISAPPRVPSNFTLCFSMLPTQVERPADPVGVVYFGPITIGLIYSVQDSKPFFLPGIEVISINQPTGLIDIPYVGRGLGKEKWNSLCLSVDTAAHTLGHRVDIYIDSKGGIMFLLFPLRVCC